MYSFVSLNILISMYVPFWVFWAQQQAADSRTTQDRFSELQKQGRTIPSMCFRLAKLDTEHTHKTCYVQMYYLSPVMVKSRCKVCGWVGGWVGVCVRGGGAHAQDSDMWGGVVCTQHGSWGPCWEV